MTLLRVLILTWEYPPKRLGSVADHVFTLSHELVKQGYEIEVLAEDDLNPGIEDVAGVHIHRVANPIKTHPNASLLTFAMTASVAMEQEASNIIYHCRKRGEKIDLVHAHEWLTISPAVTLKYAFNLPFIITLHSIEAHRCHGIFGPINIAIQEVESTGVQESAKVLTTTEWMKDEILKYYGENHRNKVQVLPPEGWVQKMKNIYGEVIKTS